MSRLTTCKTCGAKIAKSAKVCPHCGARIKHPIVTILCTLIIFWAAISIYFVISDANLSVATKSVNNDKQTTNNSLTTTIIDDNIITAEFLGFDNAIGVDAFLTNIRVTNKTDKKIACYLTDASVNNETMQMVMTGVTFNILPNKTGKTGFIFPFAQLSIKSLAEVQTVSFNIAVYEESALGTLIETTNTVTINK